MIRYRREGGRPPADREHLDVADDGAFRLWRSNAAARAGVFTGTLSDADADAVAAAGRGPFESAELAIEPDDATETIEVDGARLRHGSSDPAPDGWRPIVEIARRLVNALVTSPHAAVELDVSDPTTVALVHSGDAPLALDLRGGEVRIVRVRPDGTYRSSRSAAIPGGEATAEPGWRLDLAVAPDADVEPGDRLVVSASIHAFDGETRVPLELVDSAPA